MSGIQYLNDGKGNKTAAVIDLKLHKPFGRTFRT